MEKNKLNFIYTTIPKSLVVAESKDAIKINLKDDLYFWIQKKYAFPSQYMNVINISLVEGWKYELKNDSGIVKFVFSAQDLKQEL